MDWNIASQIATSVGALLAAASLAAGFLIYRINQRDEFADELRLTIAKTKPHVEQLRDMVSFELARELASLVVHSRDLELPLEDLFKYCRPNSTSKPSRDEVEKYLDEYFPAITVPLNTPLVRQCQQLTTSIASDISLYQTTFPGLYRVVSSIALLLANIVNNEKAIARDEEFWKAVLPDLMENEDRITSLAHMKGVITDVITMIVMTHMKEARTEIALLNQMTNLVFEAYLDKTPAELKYLSRAERKEKMLSTSETGRITDDLREAERGLRHAFSGPSQLAQYRDLLVRFEEAGERGGLDEEEDSEGAAGAGGTQGQEEDHAAADGHDAHLATDDGEGEGLLGAGRKGLEVDVPELALGGAGARALGQEGDDEGQDAV